LQALGLIDANQVADMEVEIAKEVADAWTMAQADAYPPLSALTSRVFADTRGTQ
jgi:TPP-dependent pyruvate/acetoin dehydrogenase alpha subunit